MKFTNPQNGHTEESSIPWLWCLLFGFIYFIYKRCWVHALISLILAFLTYGISGLIYPFFARAIVRNNYFSRGWIDSENQNQSQANSQTTPSSSDEIAFKYRDVDGNITNRQVSINNTYTRNEQHYIEGHCYLRDEGRTFRIDRIIGDVTLCDTGEIIPKELLIEESENNNQGNSIPDHLDIPNINYEGRVFCVKDHTNYEDVLTFGLSQAELKNLSKDDIDAIDPEELDLEVAPFSDTFTNEKLKRFPDFQIRLPHVLEEAFFRQQNPDFEEPIKKYKLDPSMDGLLKSGYLVEIPRTPTVEKHVISEMNLEELRETATSMGIKVSQNKGPLAAEIIRKIKPDTKIPRLAISAPKVKEKLRELSLEYLKEAEEFMSGLPQNYRAAIRQAIKDDAELPFLDTA